MHVVLNINFNILTKEYFDKRIFYRDSLGCGIIYLIANGIFLCRWGKAQPAQGGRDTWLYNSILLCSMFFCFWICLPKETLHLLPSISSTPDL